MTISRNDEWIQIADLDAADRIVFTPAFREIMGDLGWEAKAFVGHLLGLWYDPFEHMLDYTSGEAKHTQDQLGEFDCNDLGSPQEVVEYWADIWSKGDKHNDAPHHAGTGLALDVEWYRDVLRAKLVSIRLPTRLLLAYRERAEARSRKLDQMIESRSTDHIQGAGNDSEARSRRARPR